MTTSAARLGYPEFAERLHRHFCRDANRCLTLGVDERLGELPDPSLAEGVARQSEAKELFDLAPSSADEPDFERALDLGLARLMLRAELDADALRYNGLSHAEQLPCAGDDIGNGLFLLLVNDPRPIADRLRDITSRLGCVPDYLDALLARLQRPIGRWVSMDLEKIQGLDTLFDSIRTTAIESSYSELADLSQAIEAAQGALAVYSQRLAALPVGAAFAVGSEAATRIVANRGIALSLPELHALARRFLSDNAAICEELRGRLCSKYRLAPDTSASALDQYLKRRFAARTDGPELDAILDRYAAERDKVLQFVEASGLFPVPSDQAMKILRTPRFMEPSIPAGAMLSPAPFRTGTKVSLIYLTLSEALRDEHTELGIPHMMVHEGIPGHHLQLSHAALHPSTIRRHVSAMDQAEGWTTMLEDYMLDIGYMGAFEDETRFVGKRELNRIGARVAIDLFFMTGDRQYLDVGTQADVSDPDPYRAAGALLKTTTGFVDERVEAELNWYSQERGYPLSYLAGNHLVWQLKRDVERSRGDGRSRIEIDRSFHDVFLQAGSMPVAFLRRVFEDRGLLAG